MFRSRVEAWSASDQPLALSFGVHPFVAAVHYAFADHRPLVISPDHVWLLICQGFAAHVNANVEALRHLFVQHEGKKILEVLRDDFKKGARDNPWEQVFPEFSRQIQANLVGDVYDTLTPQFSTTGAAEKAAFEVTLLDTFQSYFELWFTLCGIPSVMLEGSPADWRAILERARRLAAFDLDWWVNLLIPVLEQLVRTAEGHVDRAFWESLYKFHNESGGPYISGWLVKFFPYVESLSEDADGGAQKQYKRNPYLDYEYTSADSFEALPPARQGADCHARPLNGRIGTKPMTWNSSPDSSA